MLSTCHSLLQQGGYITIAAYGKHTMYRVGPNDEKEFHLFYFTDEIARQTLTEAGFNLERFELIKVDPMEFVP